MTGAAFVSRPVHFKPRILSRKHKAIKTSAIVKMMKKLLTIFEFENEIFQMMMINGIDLVIFVIPVLLIPW
jgi:hypothetical protein